MNYWFRLPFNINNTYFYFVGNFTAGLKLNVKNKDLMMNVYISDISRQNKKQKKSPRFRGDWYCFK